jgi:hypothetical protein
MVFGFGFVRHPGQRGLVERAAGPGWVGQDVFETAHRSRIGPALSVRSAREIGSPGGMAACCQALGSFGALARARLGIPCDVATTAWQAADR